MMFLESMSKLAPKAVLNEQLILSQSGRGRLVLRRDKGRGRKSSRVCAENGIRADDVMESPKAILAGRLPAPVRWVCCQDLIATIKQIPNERLVRNERGRFRFDGLIIIIANSDFWMFNRQP
jgi:hypothetical protein